MTAPVCPCERVAPDWGGPLTEADNQALANSWITSEIAEEAMLRRVDTWTGRDIVGQKGNRDCAGLLFPYYMPGEPRPVSYRIRRDHPDWTTGKGGKPKPDKKYLGAPGSANRLYFPPRVTLEQLGDPKIAIALTEGEKKALALLRLASHESEIPRFIPIALPGAWNWRGTIGKTGGPKGERLDLTGAIPDLSRIECGGRIVLIVFDANVQSNESVNLARKGLARELATRGASVKFVNLPEDCGVNGIDDLLAAWGPSRVLELFDRAVSGARLQVVPTPQFQSRPEGMFRVTTKDDVLTQVQLTTYRSNIKANIRLDDGVETRREFELESELMGRTTRFTIPASEFARMDWPIEQMGSGAITFPNQRDYARTAIQSLSLTAEERCIYTHTGWRKVDGQFLYLHAIGAIGAGGLIEGVSVRMHGSLSRYELRLPPTLESLVMAVKASLLGLELGPPAVSFPLRAATCRAVFGDSDFAIHLAGETGAFKSELAALEQQHFGSRMNRLNLPGAWSSTANALEALAFYAKDSLIVIDDFAPQGSTADIARYHAAADRVFRAAGNLAGRSRLDSVANLREAKPPRSLILSTGEDIPRGHSIRARLLILELSRGSVKANKLTECQEHAGAGLYAEAMGAFIRWLANRFEPMKAALGRRVAELRTAFANKASHARTPEIIANLQAGFEFYLEFSEECGAIDRKLRDIFARRCWEALLETAATQSKHQAATEPTARFLELLGGCLASGRAHLAPRLPNQPDRSPESCGWRRDDSGNWSRHGAQIGWTDNEDIYLEPTVAYRVVQTEARDASSDVLSVTDQTFRKRLHEKGLLASVDAKRGTLTVRRSIAGSSRDVLHFSRSTILPEDPEQR